MWDPKNFALKRSTNVDPVSLNQIGRGRVYFTIPSTSAMRIPLSKNSFQKLVKRTYPGFTEEVNVWDLMVWPQNAVLFQNPLTRANVRVKNVQMHTQPHYHVVSPKNKNGKKR